MAPYTSLFCQYVRDELGCETDRQYEIFGGIKSPWDWGSAGDGHPDTSDALRKAMTKNPYMKIYVASGYYDLATPFFATEYTLNHMGVGPDLLENVEVGEYEAGHMMYIDVACLKQLKKEVAAFVKSSS
jgi:carboxypeptidase C (cathepsin A)